MEKQKQIGEYIVHFASVFPAQEAYDFSASLLWVDSSSCFHIFLAVLEQIFSIHIHTRQR